jgi:hypothetical protein
MKTTEQMIEVMQAYCEGAEIELITGDKNWEHVLIPAWNWYEFDYRVKKSAKKLKLLAWFDGGRLLWQTNEMRPSSAWKRVPSEDKEIEAEDD